MNQFEGAEKLDLSTEEEVVVVNPNPGRPYALALGGKEVTFHPLQKYRMTKSQIGTICDLVHSQWIEMKANAQSERQEWAKRVTSASQLERDKALKFCDKNGDPHTKPPKRPFLVRMDNAAGVKWYEEGMSEQREAQAEAEKPAPKLAPTPQPEEPEVEAGDIDTIDLEEPKKGWTMKQLLEYCHKHGAHVDDADKDRSDVLIKRARLAFEAKKLLYSEKKINFKIK
jgi:hypothetical protein